MHKTYYVYIMASISRTLYIGFINDLQRRVMEHKVGVVSGFSSKYKCFKLVYSEWCTNVNEAIAREKQLKRWGRKKKIGLIESVNPHWRDLSS